MTAEALFLAALFGCVLSQDVSVPPEAPPSPTEHPGGTVVNDKLIFSRARSPYWLRNDVVVERDAEMVVEPGVTIRVEPQVGITVRGVLTAVVSDFGGWSKRNVCGGTFRRSFRFCRLNEKCFETILSNQPALRLVFNKLVLIHQERI